jgi:hypothetical protein
MPARGIEIVVLKKNSDFHSSTLPDGGIEELYKRCGFKKPDDFSNVCSWTVPELDADMNGNGKNIYIRVFGKTTGRAGAENKTELPPPADKTLFFGNIAVVAFSGNNINKAKPIPLAPERLRQLFELLIGGTDDLGGEGADAADAAEDAEAERLMLEQEKAASGGKVKRTKAGYVKDDFVVEDDEVEMIEGADDEDDDADEDDDPEDDDEDDEGDDEEEGEDDGEVESQLDEGDDGIDLLEGALDDPNQLQLEEYDSE